MHPGTGPRVEPERALRRARRDWTRGSASERRGATLVLLDVGLGAASNAIAAWRVSEALPRASRRLEIVSFDHDLDALEARAAARARRRASGSRGPEAMPTPPRARCSRTAATRRRARCGGSASATFRERSPASRRVRRHRVLGLLLREDGTRISGRRRRSARCAASAGRARRCTRTAPRPRRARASCSAGSRWASASGPADRDETTIAATRRRGPRRAARRALARAPRALVGAVSVRRTGRSGSREPRRWGGCAHARSSRCASRPEASRFVDRGLRDRRRLGPPWREAQPAPPACADHRGRTV